MVGNGHRWYKGMRAGYILDSSASLAGLGFETTQHAHLESEAA